MRDPLGKFRLCSSDSKLAGVIHWAAQVPQLWIVDSGWHLLLLHRTDRSWYFTLYT